jgi:polyadenylate-binding protein
LGNRILILFYSLDDEEALRAKVDEALNVYDEYMKNKGTDGEAASEAKPQEAAKEASSEENKS